MLNKTTKSAGLAIFITILSALSMHVSATEFLKRDPHEPIWIRGDADFTPENGVIGGSGSLEDPYLISGWDIRPVGFGIKIENTTAHVLVESNYIHDGGVFFEVCREANDYCVIDSICFEMACPIVFSTGVFLINVTNVIASRNFIADNPVAMRIEAAENVRIERNMVAGTLQATLSDQTNVLEESAGIEIEEIPPLGLVVKDVENLSVWYNTLFNFQVSNSQDEPVAIQAMNATTASFGANRVFDSKNAFGIEDSTVIVVSNDIRNISQSAIAIHSDQNQEVSIRGNYLENARGSTLCGPGTFLVASNELVNSFIKSDATVSYCQEGLTRTTFANNIARNSYIAIRSAGQLMSNLFVNTTVVVRDHAISINENRFMDSEQALSLVNSESGVYGNSFRHNEYAILSWGLRKPAIHANCITGNTIDVANYDSASQNLSSAPSTTPLDAEENWWGTQSRPDPTRFVGAIDVEPWLAEASC